MLLPNGGKAPGEGATASVLFGARKGLKPVVVGKPHQPMLDAVQASLKFDPTRTIMVGDRLETDILFGIRGGISTLLVLTGESRLFVVSSVSSCVSVASSFAFDTSSERFCRSFHMVSANF